MRRSLSRSTVLIACLASSLARAETPKLDLDFGIPSGTAMLCQFDRKVTETKKKKTEEQVVNFAVISGKSALLCDGEGVADHEAMNCKRFEFVGKNDGGSIIFVSDDGYKLTTNLLALSFGAGVSVEDLKMTASTAYTGTCRDGNIEAIKKAMPGYEE